MECVINEISRYVNGSHKQACSDLEKASQLITKALQCEVQRNTKLCTLIHRLEENGRSQSEQTESNRQLKLQVDELQKQLKEKADSLTQATKSIVILKLELRHLKKQMQSHEGSQRTIQEVAEWLQDGESSQPNVVKEASVQQSPVGVKKEDTDGYQCGQSGEADSPMASSSTHIKSELLQEGDEMSDMAPVSSSERSQSPLDPVKALRLSVQVVDFCETQDQQGPASEDNGDGEQSSSGLRMEKVHRRRSYNAELKLRAIALANREGNRAAAREFGVNESMVGRWRKQQEQLSRCKTTTKSFRKRKSNWPELENALVDWVIAQRAGGRDVTFAQLQSKAQIIAATMKIGDFRGDTTWLTRCMKRKGVYIKSRQRTPHDDGEEEEEEKEDETTPSDQTTLSGTLSQQHATHDGDDDEDEEEEYSIRPDCIRNLDEEMGLNCHHQSPNSQPFQ
ncbi:uncharacterized protein LOC134464083 isoform X3 [Engraulis encrasicolus]|uniref:uncharacterized protein LOC134464083 isoform X3 n=1 Tax=Engraulis encrasicolus TaxID=184585 RepID=UPI002FD21586